jgi:hypothetical protein
MLKTLLVAAGVALGVALSGQAAEAKTHVFIGIGGFPGGYCGGYYYDRYRCGGYGYIPHRVYRDPYIARGISCSEAAWRLRDRGYRNVVARDCRGSTYGYTARKRGGPVSIRVNAYNGGIISVRPIYY